MKGVCLSATESGLPTEGQKYPPFSTDRLWMGSRQRRKPLGGCGDDAYLQEVPDWGGCKSPSRVIEYRQPANQGGDLCVCR